MAVSSINFQKSSEHSYDHNFRYDSPNYLLKEEDRLENSYWKNDLSAKEIFNNELSRSNRRGGRIPKFENSHWEAVLNLNKEHTLDDVKKVADYLENKLNITCATISVHRDEGHYKKNGKVCYNFHAHLTFVTYKDGQQNWRKEKIKPQTLGEIQTEVAKILKMERGQENSKKTRLSAKQYKKVAQELEAKDQEIQEIIQIQNQKNELIQDKDQKIQELIQIQNQEIQELKTELEQERLSKNQLEKLIKEERKAMIQKNKELEEANQQKIYNADDYKKLRELKEKQDITIAELNAEIEKIKQEAQEREENLRNEIRSKDQQIETLTAKNEALKAEKEQFQKLLETNQALREAYYHALKTLEKISKQNQEQKNEVIQTQNQEKTPNNEELTENNGKQATHFLNNFFKDDVSIFSKTNTDKTEISEEDQEQNQTYNEEDDLGIYKILQPRKNK